MSFSDDNEKLTDSIRHNFSQITFSLKSELELLQSFCDGMDFDQIRT